MIFTGRFIFFIAIIDISIFIAFPKLRFND